MKPVPLSGVILEAIPAGLRQELMATFHEIERNFRERRWEPSELNGGKFCEVVYTTLNGYAKNTYPTRASKPGNFVDACRSLEAADKSKCSQAIRITIPRILVALYEVRNNRGVGHVGGDVDPNEMDATLVLHCAKWVMSELVRHFHKLTVVEAQTIVGNLTARTSTIIWEIGDQKRVLFTETSMKEKVLLLLYSTQFPVHDEQMFSWVEHTNKSIFRRDVLKQLHRDKFIEYDNGTQMIHLSPSGVDLVEQSVLPHLNDTKSNHI